MADWFDSQNTGVTGGRLGGFQAGTTTTPTGQYAPDGSITAPGFYAPPAITSPNAPWTPDPNKPQGTLPTPGNWTPGPGEDPRLGPYQNDWSPRNPDGSLSTGGIMRDDPRLLLGSPTSTLGDFLKDTSKMQAVGQGMQHITGMIGGGQNPAFPNASPMARASNPTTMGSLFGSAFGAAGGAGGQMARVMMKAPDGSTQSVDPAHVQHYTGLGAQVVNGSGYGGNGGSNYGNGSSYTGNGGY